MNYTKNGNINVENDIKPLINPQLMMDPLLFLTKFDHIILEKGILILPFISYCKNGSKYIKEYLIY